MLKKWFDLKKDKFRHFVIQYHNAFKWGDSSWALWVELKIIFWQAILIVAALILVCARKWIWFIITLVMLFGACWLYWVLEFKEDVASEEGRMNK